MTREVIFEITAMGAVARVCAVDVATGTEAIITGPVSAGRTMLEKTALRKLEYVLNKRFS